MKRPLLHQIEIVIAVIGVFFSAAPFAQANTLSLPPDYTYPGLTFSNPLSFSQTSPLSEQTTLTFAYKDKLAVTAIKANKPLETVILTPTFAATGTRPDTSLPQPTPTIYLQPTDNSIPATQEPTATPTPHTAEQAAVSPTKANYTPVPESTPGGLNASVLFGMVNQYRTSQGLPPFQQDAKTCSLAQQRAPQVAGEIASGNMHAGLKALNLPYWNTENIISMNSEQAAFNWWINDPIHHDAIVSNATYSCVACSGNSCAEEFTSYVAK